MLVVVAVLVPARAADAHAVLESSSPLPGSVLTRSPTQIVLHFDDTVYNTLGSIKLFDSEGDRLDNGVTFHPHGNTHDVAESVPALDRGSYVVSWRVISDDSHPVGNAFVFSLGAASVSKARVAAPTDAQLLARRLSQQSGSTLVGFVYWVVRALQYGALLALAGAITMLTFVWRGGWGISRARRAVWWAWTALVAMTVATVLVQGPYAAATSITHVVNPTLVDSVLHTRIGEMAVARLILLMLLALLITFRADSSARHVEEPEEGSAGGWWALAATALGLGLFLTFALSGHASSTHWVFLGTVFDVLHLAGASLWTGVLLMLAAVVLRSPRPDGAARICRRASTVAFAGVAAVVASGVLQSVRQLTAVSDLWSTAYGRLLLVKVLLVCALVGVGAASRRLVGRLGTRGHEGTDVPRVVEGAEGPGGVATLASPAGQRSVAVAEDPASSDEERPAFRLLLRSVLAEAVIAAAVLGATAGLVNSIPPQAIAAEPFAQTVSAGGVQTTVLVEPSRAGPGNQFHIFTLKPDGLPADVSEVDVSLRLPDKGIGPLDVAVINGGLAHFIATDVDIPISGTWLMTITVHPTPQVSRKVSVALPVR